MPDYPTWLAQRIAERAERCQVQAPQNHLSILTCVYGGSPAAFLRETAESVLSQSQPGFEWVALANGPLNGDLDSVLAKLAGDTRVRVLDSSRNVGIIQGLRLCLEAARGEYAFPLDADDLLTADAVSVMAAATLDGGHHEFLYGDEDALVQGQLAAPYFRPDWDPLLNLSSSYIWHPSLFRRQTALELGVFSDPESEYCQDWDTVFRFADAGVVPIHMPEVLYHWRAHSGSSTNRPERDEGSLKSQRHVLEAHLTRLGLARSYDITEFPLDRGLPEWWIRSTSHDASAMDVVVVGDGAFQRQAAGMPFDRVQRCEASEGIAGLRTALAGCGTDNVVVLGGLLKPEATEWASEANGILDLLPEVDIVGGRLVSETGVVIDGELLIAPNGRTVCPDRRRPATEAGYYSLSLKPHLVDGVSGRFFVARRRQLSRALEELPRQASLTHLGAWLGAWAAQADRLVAYTPLLTAVTEPSDEACEAAGPREQRALVDMMTGAARPSRWAWRKRCAELGEGRPLESGS